MNQSPSEDQADIEGEVERPGQELALSLSSLDWAELIGVLLGLTWYEPQRERLGQLAGRLYAEYIHSFGADPASVAELTMLPERLRGLVTDHG